MTIDSPLVERRRKPRPDTWLPDFCSLPVLFALLIVAELVVLVILLAPHRAGAPALQRVFVASVYVQWLAVCCAFCLCRLRPSHCPHHHRLCRCQRHPEGCRCHRHSCRNR